MNEKQELFQAKLKAVRAGGSKYENRSMKMPNTDKIPAPHPVPKTKGPKK